MYSQNSEDEAVAAQFPDNYRGCLLEIGAWEPRNLSNSRLLIERGWSAVLVEFSPVPLSQLVREYGNNQNVQVVSAAITPCNQHVVEFQITDDALSTNDPEQLRIWAEKGGFYGRLYVPSLTVDALLSQFFGSRQIDFASVDTEGTSCDVAIALIQSDHRPKVICCEFNNRAVELMEVAQNVGYKMIHMNSENMILCR